MSAVSPRKTGSRYASAVGLALRWGPAAAWALLIGAFSTEVFSSRASERFFFPFLRWVFPDISWPTVFLIHDLARKAAHVVEYFIFSLLLLRGFRGDRPGWRISWALAAMAVVAGYSTLDEIHQTFVPGRVGSFADILLDTGGGGAGQALARRRAEKLGMPGKQADGKGENDPERGET